MSLTEILAELPALSHEERRELCRRTLELEAANSDALGGELKGTPPSLWEALKDFDGMAGDLPADLADNLDHYVHGHPRA